MIDSATRIHAKPTRCRTLLAVLAIGAGAMASATADETALDATNARIAKAAAVAVENTAGKRHFPLRFEGDRRGVLMFFVLHDCPKANAIVPEMNRLCALATQAGITPFFVYAEPDLTPTDAARHAREFALAAPALLDTDLALAAAVGATVTPEAALISGEGELIYRGTIDDRFTASGRTRAVVRAHFLRDRLLALARGESPTPRITPAVGCYIPTPTRAFEDRHRPDKVLESTQ